MDYNLERFKREQEYSYNQALKEIHNGRKVSHWMWFIFPQLRGLGRSSTAEYYGIRDLEEAKAYLSDPVLGAHLLEISEALLQLELKDAVAIFGFPDVLKLRSCMTLFDVACEQEDNVFCQVLNAYYHGEKDRLTLQLMGF